MRKIFFRQVVSDITNTKRATVIYRANSTFDYGVGVNYALGAALSINTFNYENNVYKTNSLTTNAYQWWDGAVQSTINFKPNAAQAATNVSTYGYETIGGQAQLFSVGIVDGRQRNVVFTSDMSGQAIKRDEGDYTAATIGDPHELYYRFGGKQMGYVGNNGSLNTDYNNSIANRTITGGTGSFRNGATVSAPYADFDQSIAPINSYYQGASGGGYTVRQGDTLQSIAAGLWGDSALWYKIAEANGMGANTALSEGQSLILPTGAIKNTHNSSTFKPYDPSEVIGDTAPTTPVTPKPKKARCGVFGQILLVVIAVVVAVVTAGAALAALAPAGTMTIGAGISTVMSGGLLSAAGSTAMAVGIGAVAGAAGSIVSQAVGVATGIQDKFSWNAVGLAAIAGGIGAGGGSLGVGGNGIKSAIARGMIASTITQGIGVATGMQKEFSWAGVAAAGVGAAFAYQAANHWVGATASEGVRKFASSAASAIGNAAARSLIEGTDFGDNIMAALPDVIGTTIGNLIAGGIGESLRARPVQLARGEHIQSDAVETSHECQTTVDGSVELTEQLTPRQRLLRRVEDLQQVMELLDGLGSEADADLIAAAEEAKTLWQEVKDYADGHDGIMGIVDSVVGGLIGLPQGVIDSVVGTATGLWSMATHPGETFQGLLIMTEEGLRYAVRTATGEANPIADGSGRMQVFEAGVSLEQARLYLTEGNVAAARYVSSQATRILTDIVGAGKIANVSVRAIRAARGAGRAADAMPERCCGSRNMSPTCGPITAPAPMTAPSS